MRFSAGDLAPAIEDSLREQAAAAARSSLSSLLAELLPRRLAKRCCVAGGISPDAKGGRGRARAVRVARSTRSSSAAIPLSGTCGFKKAEVTAGGVSLDEVDSRTMQSKLRRNLYLAGEVLDLDGPIGGYNFQAAWSTGFLAGREYVRSDASSPESWHCARSGP